MILSSHIAAICLILFTACMLAVLPACSGQTKNDGLVVFAASVDRSQSFTDVQVGSSGMTIYLASQPLITMDDVVAARRNMSDDGRAAMVIDLTDEAGRRMVAHAQQAPNKPIAILWDGQIVSSPFVQGATTKLMIVSDDELCPAANLDAMIQRINAATQQNASGG